MKNKLVCESLEEVFEGKRAEYAHKAESKLSTGNAKKVDIDKKAKAKEAIAGLKVQLADAKKAGGLKGT